MTLLIRVFCISRLFPQSTHAYRCNIVASVINKEPDGTRLYPDDWLPIRARRTRSSIPSHTTNVPEQERTVLDRPARADKMIPNISAESTLDSPMQMRERNKCH
jgi:hypothetical protein